MGQAPVQPSMQIDYHRPLASDLLMAIGVLGGLFLMMIGSIVSGLSTNGTILDDFGNIIGSFGLFVTGGLLFLMAIIRTDLDKLIRIAYLLSATLLVVYIGFW